MATRIEQQQWDYLGNLRSKLGDLGGHQTLAFEILQNADDAPEVTELIFDVTPTGLVAINNGRFRDIDFERMKRLGSGGKRAEEDTTGAFGIGFISVYLITDQPTVESSGQRWVFHPELNGQIDVTEPINDDGRTRICLPWARDPASAVRKELGIAAVGENVEEEVLSDLQRCLPEAMLFLRKVTRVELHRDGEPRIEICRPLEENGQIYLQHRDRSGATKDELWWILRGVFSGDEQILRETFPELIEPKRHPIIELAIPRKPHGIVGLLCATLPSQQQTGFPVHANAHFYPSTDRKRILFDDGAREYKSGWNRAAVRAGALLFAGNLVEIRDFVGDLGFWVMLERIKASHEEQRTTNTELGRFWAEIQPALCQTKIVRTIGGAYCDPSEAIFVADGDAEKYGDLLSHLGFKVVDSCLSPVAQFLRSAAVGVPLLTAQRVASQLSSIGLNRAMEVGASPDWFRSEVTRRTLGWLLEALLKSEKSESRAEARQAIQKCSIALGIDGKLYPPGELLAATREEVDLFSRVSETLPFLQHGQAEVLRELCPEFALESAVLLLERLPLSRLAEVWKDDDQIVADLLAFFEGGKNHLFKRQELRDRFVKLPLFPSAVGLHPLSALLVPGDFVDPLGSTAILNIEATGGQREFCVNLGAKKLDFITYARERIPKLLSPESGLGPDERRSLVKLLAEKRLGVTAYPDIRAILVKCPIIECSGGQFETANQAYFDTKPVRDILGNAVRLAVTLPEDAIAVRELYDWLGVAKNPRPAHVIIAVKAATAGPPDAARRKTCQSILDHLKARWSDEDPELLSGLVELKQIPWLPARSDETSWYLPSKLYANSQSYLFSTQAAFLDSGDPPSGLIEFLGLKVNPSPEQVVAHVATCAERGSGVEASVYTYLNRNTDKPALQLLRGKRWVPATSGGFTQPEHIFWGEHPFGRYRFRLPQEFLGFLQLFKSLGSKEKPTHDDAKAVLLEVSAEFGPANQPLDPEAKTVVLECWRILSGSLENGVIPEVWFGDLVDRKVIPDGRNVLNPPRLMFLGDRPTLAAEFGSFLQHNVIDRPPGAWKAMRATGVRLLSSAVQVDIAECENPTPAPDLQDRLKDRLPLIRRVLEANSLPQSLKDRVENIVSYNVKTVERLELTYTVDAFNQRRTVGPKPTPAYFDSKSSTLYVRSDQGRPPWPAVSRELCYACHRKVIMSP